MALGSQAKHARRVGNTPQLRNHIGCTLIQTPTRESLDTAANTVTTHDNRLNGRPHTLDISGGDGTPRRCIDARASRIYVGACTATLDPPQPGRPQLKPELIE